MTRKSSAHRTIPLKTTEREYPIPLTNGYREYIEDELHDLFWLGELRTKEPHVAQDIDAARCGLLGRYAEPADGPRQTRALGDPRQFCKEDITSVAVMDGTIGIHTELALNHRGTPEELADVIEQWRSRLTPLDFTYNHTRFFIGLGDMTMGRALAINAFTPLENGRIGTIHIGKIQLAPENRYLMVSPYHVQEKSPDIAACPMIEEIEQVMILMAVYDQNVSDAMHKARTVVRERQAC